MALAIVLGVLYVVLLLTLGLMSIRKGHWVMFLIGIPLPIFWVIGALMPPDAGSSSALAQPKRTGDETTW